MLFAGFVGGLAEHTGIDAEYEQGGMLYPEGVGFSSGQIGEHSERRRALGFAIEHLDRAALDELQPGLGPEVTGAAWQGRSARVRPPRLLAALRRRLEQVGVEVVSECPVTALARTGERVTGVRLYTGQLMDADLVVLAAGAWSGLIAKTIGLDVDVRPVRGQMLLLRGAPGTLGPTINDGDCYLVPRRDGRILVGSTMEEAGFDAVTTADALARLRRMAIRLLPACAEMQVELDWAGLRPGTPDRLPYIGTVPEVPGLVLATGHYRNGILLAPITARLVADLVAGRAPSVDLSSYRVRAIDPAAELIPR
jgi:glycine oxidase